MLIGSRAYNYWRPGDLTLTDSDWDIITDNPPITNLKVEVHSPSEYLSSEFVERFATENCVLIGGQMYPICSLRGLAAIKMSHLTLNYKWIKHISFFHKFLKPYFNEEDWDLVLRREEITLEMARQRAPSLMMSNEEFFDDAVVKRYDHDWLHERVAYYERPLYERLKFENKFNLAWCEESLWNELSFEDKKRCVVEEATVIALERFLIPGRERFVNVAYQKSLQKVCTSLTSGWFRRFAVMNWFELSKMGRNSLMVELTEELK